MTVLQPAPGPEVLSGDAASRVEFHAGEPATLLLALKHAAADAVRRPFDLVLWPAPFTSRPAPAADDADALALLAWLRDIGARETWVLTRQDDVAWQLRLRGLGFSESGTPGGGCLEFSFSMAHYKPTPDWFGARNWAHPELFGKFRW